MLPYSCINCDVSEKWRHQLLGSWRRSLLQILKPLLDEKSDKSSYDKISSKVEHIQSLQVFMKEIEKLRFSTDRKSLKQAVTDEILQKKNFSRFYLKDFLHNLMRIIWCQIISRIVKKSLGKIRKIFSHFSFHH